jgi:hypothetical protein
MGTGHCPWALLFPANGEESGAQGLTWESTACWEPGMSWVTALSLGFPPTATALS